MFRLPPFKQQPSRGFVLMEVVIAIAILGIGIIPLFQLMSNTSASTALSQNELVAMCWAEELIEQIQCIPFTDLSPCSNQEITGAIPVCTLWPAKPDSIILTRPLMKGMSCHINVFSVTPKLKLVEITMQWGTQPVHELHLNAFAEWRL